MAVTRYETVNNIVNSIAVEVGFDPVADVFAANDTAFTQMTYLLTACAQELMESYPWQILVREYQYTTVGTEAGELSLPTDFAYMIPQTGWERSQSVPLAGPLSPQEWTYLLGRSLVGSTIYASFRFDQGKLYILPNDPTPSGLDINYEYISRNVIQKSDDSYSDEALEASDVVLFPPNMVKRMLKMKYLEAKGFNTAKAERDFSRAVSGWMGKDNSSRIISASGNRNQHYPYLNGTFNVPDTGYGG